MYSILVVDDEQEIREGLRHIVDWSKLGFEIAAESDNGEDALELMQNGFYNVLLTDIRLPAISGLELIKNLHNKSIMCKIVVFSAFADFEYVKSAMDYGVKKYLLKPINEDELAIAFKEIKSELDNDAQSNMKIESAKLLRGMVQAEDIGISEDTIHKSRYSYIRSLAPPFCCSLIKLDSCEKQQEIMDGIQGILSDTNSGFVFEELSDILILLLISQDGTPGYIRKMVDILGKHLESKLGDSFQMILGQIVWDFKSINESYNSVKKIMILGTSIKKGTITAYEDLKNTFSPGVKDRRCTTGKLIEAIRTLNIQEVEMQIRYLEEYAEQSDAHTFLDYAFFSSVVVGIIETVEELNYITLMEEIYRYGNLKSMISQLKTICLNVCKTIGNSNDVITKIKYYIEDSCCKNINIKSISKEFGYNACYLGRMFSREVGLSIKDYITLSRINRGCQMLMEGNFSIEDIASELGFTDLNKFYISFKKLKGCTPRKYRSIMENELENDM